MKLYNFLEIFGEYISTEKYREMLKNTMFTDLHINKEESSITALLHIDTFNNIMCLKAVSGEIKKALAAKNVEFDYRLPPDALKTECFPMLLRVVKKNVPQANGFLDDVDTSFDGKVFTVRFLKHGRDICQNAGADKFLEEYISEHFERQIEVVFEGEDSNEEEFLRKQREIDVANLPYKPEEVNLNFDDVPLDFNNIQTIYGNYRHAKPKPMSSVNFDDGEVLVWGDVFKYEKRETKDGKRYIIDFNITDNTGSFACKFFDLKEQLENLDSKIKDGVTVVVKGVIGYDDYKKDYIIKPHVVSLVNKIEEVDEEEEKRVELHLHTNMSAMDAMSSAKSIVKKAMKWGHKAIAITDHGCVQAFPEACNTARGSGFKIIYGCECYLVNDYNEDGSKKSLDEMKKDHSGLPHGGVVIRSGNTGLNNENKHIIEYAKVGMTLRELNNELIRYYEEKLPATGLLKDGKTIRDYYFHGVSHMLGLETHDVQYADYRLEEGNVFTVEPGLYIEEENIGIRIEDDVLMTKDGCINLSSEIIKEVADIEAFMSQYE